VLKAERELMKIPKPTAGDRERFTALVPEASQAEVKPMFGNLGVFVNGIVFMGLFGSDVGIKLPRRRSAAAACRAGHWPVRPARAPHGRICHHSSTPARRHREGLDRQINGLCGWPAAEEAQDARETMPVAQPPR
jgi:hypothetical protein